MMVKNIEFNHFILISSLIIFSYGCANSLPLTNLPEAPDKNLFYATGEGSQASLAIKNARVNLIHLLYSEINSKSILRETGEETRFTKEITEESLSTILPQINVDAEQFDKQSLLYKVRISVNKSQLLDSIRIQLAAISKSLNKIHSYNRGVDCYLYGQESSSKRTLFDKWLFVYSYLSESSSLESVNSYQTLLRQYDDFFSSCKDLSYALIDPISKESCPILIKYIRTGKHIKHWDYNEKKSYSGSVHLRCSEREDWLRGVKRYTLKVDYELKDESNVSIETDTFINSISLIPSRKDAIKQVNFNTAKEINQRLESLR